MQKAAARVGTAASAYAPLRQGSAPAPAARGFTQLLTCRSISEQVFHGELHDARRAGGIDLAEQRAVHGQDGRAEVRVV